jgi:hypothetical protein
MKYFYFRFVADGSKSQFPLVNVRLAVAATFLALLIAGPVLAQIPPPQKLALPKSEKNIGKETDNGKGDDKNLSVSLQDTTQVNILNNSRMAKIGPNCADEQVWCDGVELENGVLTFKGVGMRGGIANLSTSVLTQEDFKKLTEEFSFDFSKANTKNIRDIKQQKNKNIATAHLLLELKTGKQITSVMVLAVLDINTDSSLVRVNMIDGKIISNDGEMYIGMDGAQICATDKAVAVTLPGVGEGKRRIGITLNQLVDGEAPP